jgi:hypothetical protein
MNEEQNKAAIREFDRLGKTPVATSAISKTSSLTTS